MSRLRHLGWNQCSHGLTSGPLGGGFRVSQGFSFGASGWHTEAPTPYNSFYHAFAPHGLYLGLGMGVVKEVLLPLVIFWIVEVTLVNGSG